MSIWSNDWTSWLWAVGALLSGSLAGAIPSFARLAWKAGRYGRLVVLGGIGVSCLTALIYSSRFSSRIEVWHGLRFLKSGWLTGWGFFPMPGTFQEDILGGGSVGSALMSDYHSTFLDFIGRFGLIGLISISPLIYRITKLTFHPFREWKIWTLLLAVIVGSIQSAEAFAVMCVLGLIWWMRLEAEEVNHLLTV